MRAGTTNENLGSASARRRWLGAVVAALALIATVALPAQPAHASNWPPNSGVADGSYHTYIYVSLELYTLTAVNWGEDRIDATDMNTAVQTGTCNGGIDVCVYDEDYTGSAWATKYGKVDCSVWASGTVCDRKRMRFDTSNLDGYSTTYLRRAGCHEWGHTPGLDHPSGSTYSGSHNSYSCMWSGIGDTYQSMYYNQHDTDHINAEF